MGKFLHDDVLDAGLNTLLNNGTRLCVCSQQPVDYTGATATYMLAMKNITSGDFTGPVNGGTGGRKVTVNAQNAVSVTNGGTATHIAVCDSVHSKLLEVDTCASLVLAQGGEVNIPAHDVTFPDPI